jgi:hypothetical protein
MHGLAWDLHVNDLLTGVSIAPIHTLNILYIGPLALDSSLLSKASGLIRAVVGGGGEDVVQKVRMTKKFPNISSHTKVFAIWKMKTQFTNKNTNILRTDILQKHAVP